MYDTFIISGTHSGSSFIHPPAYWQKMDLCVIPPHFVHR